VELVGERGSIPLDQWFLVVLEQLLPSNEERTSRCSAIPSRTALAAVWNLLAT
jgi:hypothetical protein